MREELKKSAIWILVAFIMSAGVILSSVVVTNGLIKIKSANAISVTGSAKKQIKSDLIVWRGSFAAQSVNMAEAYNQLKVSQEKVKSYLKSKGIQEKDMVISSINTNTNYVQLPNGQYTSQIESYRLYQEVQITSTDVDKITTISREATELLNEGIEFQSMPPQYYYTKIAELKVDMMGQATADAKNRAEQIAKSTGGKVGALRSAKMGVYQITPLYSTEISDYGINDTSSLDKEVTAVVTCNFEIN